MSGQTKDTRLSDLVQVMLDEGAHEGKIYWRLVEAMELVGAQPILVADASTAMDWVEELAADDPDTTFDDVLNWRDFGHGLDPVSFAMALHALRKQWPLTPWWVELVKDGASLGLPGQAWDHLEAVKAYILQRAAMKWLKENQA